MKIYLVGGAVRDHLLHLPIKEKDWVVVGATVDGMIQQGFRPVGKDFPVFLHPKTKEEYALARTERKVGRGYTGFDFDTSPHVTLEEDLIRRDLTINAMAQTSKGELVDPYHGKQDLERKLLRHVSPAFVEDPVRILRVARFAARFADLGFVVAKDTNELMKQMVLSGEVDALVAERVWKELERALAENHPEQFFQVLADCEALPVLFPSIEMSHSGMSALAKAAAAGLETEARFAALLHDNSEAEIKNICTRYRVPSDYRDLALLVAQQMDVFRKVRELSAQELLSFLLQLDAFRREARFKQFLSVCEVATGFMVSAWIDECYRAAKIVRAQEFLDAGFVGKALAEKINEQRVEKIKEFMKRQCA